MDRSIFLDTHVVVWLHSGKVDFFSDAILSLLESSELCISSFVEMELQYLYEIDRITVRPERVLADLEKEIGLKRKDSSSMEIIKKAAEHSWTRDPFDRLVVSQADLLGLQLVTKDRTIKKNYIRAVW